MEKKQMDFGAFEMEQMREFSTVKKETAKQKNGFDLLQVGPVNFSDEFYTQPITSKPMQSPARNVTESQRNFSEPISQSMYASVSEKVPMTPADFAPRMEAERASVPQSIGFASMPVAHMNGGNPPISAPQMSFDEFKVMMRERQKGKESAQNTVVAAEKTKKKRLSKKEKEAIRLAELERKRAKRKKFIERAVAGLIVVTVLMIPLLIAMFFNSTVFIAKNIRIEGTARYTQQDILTLLGIRYNQSLSTISTEAIKRKIDTTSDLELMKFSFFYPDSIYIRLREKTAVSRVVSNGYYYYLDEYGDVIRKELRRDESVHYIELKNLIMHNSVFSNKPEIKKLEQKEIYIKVMNAIVKLGYQEEIKEMSILSNKDIQISTKDGFTLSVASQGDIAQMIYNAFATKNMQRQLQIQNSKPLGGLITVSNVFNAVYSNEDENNKVNYVPTYVLNPSPSSVYGKDQSEAQDLIQSQQPENAQDGTTDSEKSEDVESNLSQIGIEDLDNGIENAGD